MASRVLTALGQEFLEEIPREFRADPDIKAAIDVKSREVQRFRDRLTTLSNGIFPQLDTPGAYIAIWEFTLGLSVAPDGYTIADRRARVLAFLQKLHRTGSGLDFEQTAAALMGVAWTYEEYIPVADRYTNLLTNPNAQGVGTLPATIAGWTPRSQANENFQEVLLGKNNAPNPVFAVNAANWQLNMSAGGIDLGSGRAAMPDAPSEFGWRVFCQQPADANVREYGVIGPSTINQNIPTTPGETWTVAADYYTVNDAIGSRGLRPRLFWYTAAGALITTSTAAETDDVVGTRQRVSYTDVAPLTAAFVRPALAVITNTSGDVIDTYITKISMRIDGQDAYLDPSVPGTPAFRLVRDMDGAGITSIYMNSATPGPAATAGKWVACAAEMIRHPRALTRNGGVSAHGNVTPTIATSGGLLLVNSDPDGPWHRVSVVGQVPPGADATASFRVFLNSADEGENFFARRVVATVADTQPRALLAVANYFDGSMAGYEWLGTAHASTSRKTSTVAPNTIRIKVAYASGSSKAADIRALLRATIPAHLQIQIDFDEGFIIGDSLIGIDPL